MLSRRVPHKTEGVLVGGCSLNYVDIGDVLGHDMMRGVIVAIDATDDTCTVDVDGRTLTKVPLFFNGGMNTTQRVLPSGIWSIKGAALDFEIGDVVIVMIGRGIFDFENFVLGQVAGKSIRYYLADFKKMYVLHPATYVMASRVEHYIPDQVRIRPYFLSTTAGPWVYPTFWIPFLTGETLKEDWFLRLPPIDPIFQPMYNTLIIETAPAGYYLDPPLDGAAIRPSPLRRIYTVRTNIVIPEILSGQTPILNVNLGYWVETSKSFHSLRSIIAGQVLVLGDNLVTFDFVFEDLYLGPPGYTVALQLLLYNENLQGNWDIYSIFQKELTP